MATLDECLRRLRSTHRRINKWAVTCQQVPLPVDEAKVICVEYDILREELNRNHEAVLFKCDEAAIDKHVDEHHSHTILLSRAYAVAKEIVGETASAPPTPVPSTSGSGNGHSDLRLPALKLPTFDGSDITKYTNFAHLFKDGIAAHSALTEAQQLHFLSSSLTGEAKSIIEFLPIATGAYKQAWDLLDKKYNRPQEIIHKILARFCDQTPESKPSDLEKMADLTTSTFRALNLMKIDTTHSEYLYNFLLLRKVSPTTLNRWKITHDQHKQHSTATLVEFFIQQAQAQELEVEREVDKKPIPQTEKKPFPGPTKKLRCPECTLPHTLFRCPTFLKSTVEERWALVKKIKCCFNCLYLHHTTQDCRSRTCPTCNKRHNSLLHKPTPQPQPVNFSVATSVPVLATAIVNCSSVAGKSTTARVLLDSGATSSYLHKSILDKIDAKGTPETITVITFNGAQPMDQTKTPIVISSLDNTFSAPITVMLLKHKQTLPTQDVSTPIEGPDLSLLKLADQKFNISREIDGILGVEIFSKIMVNDSLPVSVDMMTLFPTKLGFTIFGVGNPLHASHSNEVTMATVATPAINRFWEIEEVPRKPLLTPEQEAAEGIFKTSTRILQGGRYQVDIPLRSTPPNLGRSRHLAVTRFMSLEKRMQRDPAYGQKYKEVIQDYKIKGDLIPAPTENCDTAVYLPHHGVATSTKFRVVFDASLHTTNGRSINEECLNGPRVQSDLFTIITRFRLHAIAITADISQMYRQVCINPNQYDLQRIVWRDDPNQPLQDLALTTVTWGTKPAPYLATRVLKDIATRNEQAFPAVAAVLNDNFYIDDLLSGADSAEKASQLIAELTLILGHHGFQLHKWASNCDTALSNIPTHLQLGNLQRSFKDAGDSNPKTLGISWDKRNDNFTFTVLVPHLKQLTKRKMLSQVNSIFDPMGWLNPVLVRPKILLQRLWLDNSITWDSVVPAAIAQQWHTFIADINELKNITVPRLMLPAECTDPQIILFTDSSERAYAAVTYLRCCVKGKYTTTLISAKSKVSPIRTVSLPRLELCAALLGARLVAAIQEALPAPLPVRAYSDSTITITWIKSHPNRWNNFVANRVQEIQSKIPADCWFHVNSEDNAADAASRGTSTQELKNLRLWWSGPQWLENEQLPAYVPPLKEVCEERKQQCVFVTTIDPYPLLNDVSDVPKLFRIQSYVFRFIKNVRAPTNDRVSGPLLPAEIEHSTNWVYQRIQQEGYPLEYELLSSGKTLPTTNRLLSLAPYMEKGLIRVGGRLRHSNLPYEQKFPILLPNNHPMVTRILRYMHKKHLHAGTQLLTTIVQETLWITNIRNKIKKIVHTCPTCTRMRAQVATQVMADLPAPRLLPSRPFSNTGVDFAGPITLKTHLQRGTRNYKAYVAVFVCLATRAIHLELVSTLSAEGFLQCFHRFASRRGLPRLMFSDCATNFKAVAKLLDIEQAKSSLAEKTIQWRFNPPAAPHMGGLWEAGVKSMKFHLHRIVGNVALSFEEMAYFLARIEAALNSRPLTFLSADPNDLQALTPAHFLVGGALHSIPEADLSGDKPPLRRWQMVQQMSQHFWKRWSSEYLTRLQQRPKWVAPSPNLQDGQLVLLKEPSSPLDWKLARITALFPGSDGKCRVATVRTSSGTLTRPIHQLCPLPLAKD